MLSSVKNYYYRGTNEFFGLSGEDNRNDFVVLRHDTESDEFSLLNWVDISFTPYVEVRGKERPEDLSGWKRMTKSELRRVIDDRVRLYQEQAQKALSEL